VMLNVALFDALGRHFRLSFVSRDVKGIHLCSEAYEFLGRDGVGLVFKFANDLFVGTVIQIVVHGICTGVVVLQVRLHVVI